MNYLALVKGLIKEATAMKQYKALGTPFSVFAFIVNLPNIISAFFAVISYVCMTFLYNGVTAGVQYLEKWVDERRKGMHPGVEAVFTLVVMPTIFFFHVMLSSFAFFFYIAWFCLQINMFLATLGGTRWQPFIMEASFEESDELEVTTNRVLGIVWSIIFFVTAILNTITIPLLAYEVGEMGAMGIYVLFSLALCISIPCVFKKGAPAKCDECECVEAACEATCEADAE